ncbi:aldehyde dehydrogenase family protein, partial [Prauserella cavernicola]
MIRPDHRDRVRSFEDDALADGGRVLLRTGPPLPDKGWYVEPVLLGGLPHRAAAVQQEIFGPVAVVVPFAATDVAVRLANDTA